jgi:tRNA G10  N-methylase Trm11
VIALPAPSCGWVFPSDLGVRRRLFAPDVFAHPAKLHLGLLQRLIDLYTCPGQTILDPMAGTGSLLIAATQQRNVILRDLMPEYVEMINRSLPGIRDYAGLFAGLIDVGTGDARVLEVPHFNHIITSPPYGFETGNGISNARRARIFAEQKHGGRWDRYLTQPNHASFAAGFRYAGGQENTGNKSGRNYWRDMEQIYWRLADLLPPGGRLILVIKNHYRRGKLIDVTGQTIAVVESMGLNLIARHGRYIDNPSLWQRRRREAGLPIVDVEDILVLSKQECVL